MSSWGNISSHMEILGCGLDKEKQMMSDKGKKKKKKKKNLIPIALSYQDVFPRNCARHQKSGANKMQSLYIHINILGEGGWLAQLVRAWC